MNQIDQRSYITYQDVFGIIDGSKNGAHSLETVIHELNELGIEIRKEANIIENIVADDGADVDFVPEELSDQVVGDINTVSADDSVGLYFRQMAREPLLTSKEEITLARCIEIGKQAQKHLDDPDDQVERSERWMLYLHRLARNGQDAREHLGRANTRLVVSIAKRYMGQGMPFSDLIQEGNVGLMRAVDKYDYSRGNRFSTYATWWIRQAITRALAQKTRTIRIPLHMTERIRHMYRAAQSLEQATGRRPTPEEIADQLGVSPDTVRGMMDVSQHIIALESPIGENGDSEFGDFLEDQNTPSPADTVAKQLLEETIEEVLCELTPRQSHILRLRFGLGGVEPHTLEQIANQFSLSRERIRQLEKEALRRLRNPRLAHHLRDYMT